jgi:hypothetical protein
MRQSPLGWRALRAACKCPVLAAPRLAHSGEARVKQELFGSDQRWDRHFRDLGGERECFVHQLICRHGTQCEPQLDSMFSVEPFGCVQQLGRCLPPDCGGQQIGTAGFGSHSEADERRSQARSVADDNDVAMWQDGQPDAHGDAIDSCNERFREGLYGFDKRIEPVGLAVVVAPQLGQFAQVLTRRESATATGHNDNGNVRLLGSVFQ